MTNEELYKSALKMDELRETLDLPDTGIGPLAPQLARRLER